MSKKKSKNEELWVKITRIGLIVAILAGILTIIGFFKPVKIANIEDIKALVDESNKTLMLIQEKEEKASFEIEAIDSTMLSPEVFQIHQAIETLTSSYEFINENINHINEISDKKYLKSLSKFELLVLTMDDMEISRKTNDMVISDLKQIIIPYVENEDFNQKVLSKHYQEVYYHALSVLLNAYNWNTELATLNQKLSKYNTSENTGAKRPGCKLFRLCRTSIASKDKIAFLNDWTVFLQQFIGYLSELQEYYIQNQSNISDN